MPTEPSKSLARGGNWLNHIPTGFIQGQLLSARFSSVHRSAREKHLKTPFPALAFNKTVINRTQCDCSGCSSEETDNGDCHSVELNVGDFRKRSSSNQPLVEHLDRISTQSQPVGQLTPAKLQHLTGNPVQSVSSFPILGSSSPTAQFKNLPTGDVGSSDCVLYEERRRSHVLCNKCLSIKSTVPSVFKSFSLPALRPHLPNTSSINLVPKNPK